MKRAEDRMKRTDASLVLIVEDETLIALDLEMVVEGLGYRVAPIATDLRRAIAIAQNVLPDIALIDGNLADGPTGCQVADFLSERGVYCIGVTANPEIFENCDYIEIFIIKPYNEKQISDALMQAEVARTMGRVSSPAERPRK